MSVQMAVRHAESGDDDAIRNVARRSLMASYSLSPGTIDRAVDQWYAPDAPVHEDGRSSPVVLVATVGGEVVGYSESAVDDDGGRGDIRWLHVHPDHRGRGVGGRLLERTRHELAEAGVDRLRGTVLAHNQEGNTFYEGRGFELVGTEEVELDSRTFVENVYVDTESPGVRAVTVADEEQVYVDLTSSVSGTRQPFHLVYAARDLATRYGFFCTGCESLANAMDSMGKVECASCGNTRKPNRWDAVYL